LQTSCIKNVLEIPESLRNLHPKFAGSNSIFGYAFTEATIQDYKSTGFELLELIPDF
jgi:hypothetical protein